MRHNLATLDAFARIVKVMNQTGLWDVEFAWYSPSATHWICLYGMKYGPGVHTFRPTWPCPVIEVLVTWAKFFKPSNFCIVIKCNSTFCTTNIFNCCFGIMALIEFVKQEFLNQTVAYSIVYLLDHHGMNKCTMYMCTNYHNATNQRNTWWIELLMLNRNNLKPFNCVQTNKL